MSRSRDVRIGTSGFSYPTGAGTWKGVFYPAPGSPARPRGKGKFDELAYYADHFDTVEINSSFYGPPTPETTAGWAARTPRDFEFSLKLYQKFTHPGMFKAAALKGAPGAKGAMLDALAEVNRADIDQFRQAIDPIASAGKLGALLAQFPASFKADAASIDYLGRLLHVFRDYRVAVELRHASWSDDLGRTLTLLNATKAAFVQIDEPKFRLSIRQNFLPNVTGFYYLRLHGRNAKNWWRHEKAEDRYDYLYSDEELEPFVEIAGAVQALVKKLYLYTNNHFAGKSVANANMLKEKLGLPVEGDYPEEFVERYPQMKGLARTAGQAAATGAAGAEAEVPTPARRSTRTPRVASARRDPPLPHD